LLTLKALQLLQQADVVVHDQAVEPVVLDRARRDAARIVVTGRSPSAVTALLAHRAGEGQRVVRLQSGHADHTGRAGAEAAGLRGRGIDVEIVPGVSAATMHIA